MSNQLATKIDDSAIEQVLIGGDLSKLSAPQRLQYYRRTCESLGLNPLTKPFDYINLNGKLVLYAKKDCTDQLREIKGVSIDDVDLSEVGDTYFVKVKGHDKTGRSDCEIGVVRKSDMQGNVANAQMKAVTKAKRRLTLSLCGLGWLDETEIETIPDAKPVTVADTGEIVDAETKDVTEQKQEQTEELFDCMHSKVIQLFATAWNIEKKDAAIEVSKMKESGKITGKMTLTQYQKLADGVE